jgi:hypothetical protein
LPTLVADPGLLGAIWVLSVDGPAVLSIANVLSSQPTRVAKGRVPALFPQEGRVSLGCVQAEDESPNTKECDTHLPLWQ